MSEYDEISEDEEYDAYEDYDDVTMDEVFGEPGIMPTPEPRPESQPRLNFDERIEVDGQALEIEIADCGLYVFKAGVHFAPPPPSPSNVIGVVLHKKENDDVMIASHKNPYLSSGLIAPISKKYETVVLPFTVGAALTKKVPKKVPDGQ